jgi:hypothetical protein
LSKIGKINMLKRLVKEAKRIQEWQADIQTECRNLDASWIVSGRLSLSRLPTSAAANRFLAVRTANADPVYALLTTEDIPSLDASKITSGILAPGIGGLGKALSPTWTNDYILVYKSATDDWRMEAKTEIHPVLLASDETVLSTTSTSYTSIKQFNMVKNSALGLGWSSLKVVAECYISVSGNTATLGVYVGGTLKLEISWTETSYTLKTGTIDISDLADGKYLVDFKMKVTGGTGYFRLLEVWGS